MRKALFVASAVLAACFAVQWASGQDDDKPKGGKEKKETQLVVQCKDTEGNMTFEVMSKDEFKEKKKQLPAAYKEAIKSFSALKPEEKKDAKKPEPPGIKELKSFTDADKAQKFALECQEKYDKANPKDKEEKGGKGGKSGKGGKRKGGDEE